MKSDHLPGEALHLTSYRQGVPVPLRKQLISICPKFLLVITIGFHAYGSRRVGEEPEEPAPFFEKMLAPARDFAREFLAGTVKIRTASI